MTPASSKCPMDGIDTPHAHKIDDVIEWLRIQARQYAPNGWENIAITRIDESPQPYGYLLSTSAPEHKARLCGSYAEAVNHSLNLPKGACYQIHAIHLGNPNVKAANAHDDLVAALKSIVDRDLAYIGDFAQDITYGQIQNARAAIAKAGVA